MSASTAVEHYSLHDYLGAELSAKPGSRKLDAACQSAISRHLGMQADMSQLPLRDSPPEAVLQPAQPANGELVIAYLLMGHRSFAHATLGRLIRVLWHELHVFLIHLDVRAPEAVAADLQARYASWRNVLLMQQRRAVGWGAFSMVEVLLHALSLSLAAAPHFDFFINLSDVDIAMRTNGEIVRYLSSRRGSSFVSVKFPAADAMRYHAHAHMRRFPWVECDGEGFVVVNGTVRDFFGDDGKRCCYARYGYFTYTVFIFIRCEK